MARLVSGAANEGGGAHASYKHGRSARAPVALGPWGASRGGVQVSRRRMACQRSVSVPESAASPPDALGTTRTDALLQ